MNQRPSEVSQDQWDALAKLYKSPDDIDLFTGGLAETHVPGKYHLYLLRIYVTFTIYDVCIPSSSLLSLTPLHYFVLEKQRSPAICRMRNEALVTASGGDGGGAGGDYDKTAAAIAAR